MSQKPKPSQYQQAISAIEAFVKKCKPKTSSCIKSCVVALYLSSPTYNLYEYELNYTNKIGLLQLDIDRQLKCKILRFYDLNSGELLFQFELYYGFIDGYNMHQQKGRSRRNLYTFQVPQVMVKKIQLPSNQAFINNSIQYISSQQLIEKNLNRIQNRTVGLLFKNAQQASQMQKLIKTHSPINQSKTQTKSELANINMPTSVKIFRINLNKPQKQNDIPQDLKQICSSLNLSEQDIKNHDTMLIVAYQLLKNQIKIKNKDNIELLKKIQEYQSKQQFAYLSSKKKLKIKQQKIKSNNNDSKEEPTKNKLVNINKLPTTKIPNLPNNRREQHPKEHQTDDIHPINNNESSKPLNQNLEQKKQDNIDYTHDILKTLAQSFIKQIQQNKIKLQNVSQDNSQLNLEYNKQELKKDEFMKRLRQKMKLRKAALNRRQASDSQEEKA